MRKTLLASAVAIAVVVVGITAWLFFLHQFAEELTPKIKLLADKVDFGSVFQGAKCKSTLRIFNAGDAPLVVHSIHTSCGCAAAQLKQNTVAAGDSIDVDFTLDTMGKGDAYRGEAVVFSNDPRVPRRRLELTAKVNKILTATPESVNFGFQRIGESKEVSIRLQSAETMDLSAAMEDIQNDGLLISVELRSDTNMHDGKSALLKATLAKAGKYYSELKITGKLNGKEVPPVRVPVIAYLKERFVVTPKSLLFVKGENSQYPQKRLMVRGENVSVNVERYDKELLEVSYVKTTGGYDFVVQPQGRSRTGNHGSISIVLSIVDGDQTAEVKIPVIIVGG